MAFQLRFKIGLHGYVALLMLSFFFNKNSIVTSIPTQELDAMLSIVRARGYNLFSNAITTSDLQLDLLSAADNASFTLFAPTDSSLFALAMTQSASVYTATLRYHGLPRRLSVSDLNSLPSQVAIPTLLRSQYVSVTRCHRGSRSDAISVNGINVVLPGLYYGRHVVVHGLGGILSLHSQNGYTYGSPPPLSRFRPSGPRSFPPQIDLGSNENRDFTVSPADRSIEESPVSPPISPSSSSNKTVDLPFNRVFLGPASEQPNFPVESPAISSPSVSPGYPPTISSDLTPTMQNENTVTPTPTPLISGEEASDSGRMMKSEDDMTGRTVEEYEPLDWMSLGFGERNSDDIDVEDSHPRPNEARRL
ncbi:uncharacterized protein LOC111434622 [Cucurbita moschata]|uniref:Uncharacterized protein LOC111434622 n=1 Tax=Cucurbita moschata TaxID=3662 RepID=A0A6J1EM74_CUCMO|nr:uncharacterized protein LOC111434622 [Cucurbita moschata]